MIPESVIRAIANAVEREGGDIDDVDDLIDVWNRLYADKRGRVDRLRYGAAPRALPLCRWRRPRP